MEKTVCDVFASMEKRPDIGMHRYVDLYANPYEVAYDLDNNDAPRGIHERVSRYCDKLRWLP